jgi:hypothetical protein
MVPLDAIMTTPSRAKPLPGLSRTTADDLRGGGGRAELLTVFAGLHTGRLVLLGPPGAGKSAAALHLMLDLLNFRQEHQNSTGDGAERTGQDVPVPVLSTLHGWDATPGKNGQNSVDFVADRLVVEYRGLARDEAVSLLRDGRLAVVLDGLDEVPARLRRAALRALGDAPFRVVLLSRTAEFVETATALPGAVALALQPVDARAAADYLERGSLPDEAWQAVVSRLAQARVATAALAELPAADPVVAALTRPFLLATARSVYQYGAVSGRTVDELLDPVRFATLGAIQDHLLDAYIDVTYAPRAGRGEDPERAKKTLMHLALTMTENGTRDLPWWTLPSWTGITAAPPTTVSWNWRRARRGLTVGLLLGLLVGLPLGLTGGLTLGLAGGLTVGLIFGLVGNASLDHGSSSPRKSWSQDRFSSLAGVLLTVLAVGLAGVSVIGLTLGPTAWPMVVLTGWQAVVLAGVLTGVLAGVLAGGTAGSLGAWLTGRAVDRLAGGATSRRSIVPVGVLVGLLAAAAGGAAGGLAGELAAGLAGELARELAGVTGGLASELAGATGELAGAADELADTAVGLAGSTGGLAGGASGAAGGLAGGLAIRRGMPAWIAMHIASLKLARTHRTMHPLMPFLEDAQRRGVLRTVGPVWQFRHATLQDRLAGVPFERIHNADVCP